MASPIIEIMLLKNRIITYQQPDDIVLIGKEGKNEARKNYIQTEKFIIEAPKYHNWDYSNQESHQSENLAH
jgi:hypothetical protein